MADKRKPQCRIIIEEGRSRVAVELFSAPQFPDGQGRMALAREGGIYMLESLKF
ncbi:hypothetical protein JCM15519_04160 [Fundidesulfovibrio butyratiphilus]